MRLSFGERGEGERAPAAAIEQTMAGGGLEVAGALRHLVSAVLTGRMITAYGYAEWPDGRCSVQDLSFGQDYHGARYVPESTSRLGIGSQKSVDCTP